MHKKLFFAIVSVFILIKPGLAQTDYNNVPDVTGKIFINDVYLKQYNPDTFLIHDILIDNGIIKNIAPAMEAPFDARIIEGDSIYAYSAFIDAFSHTGIPQPERRQQRPDVQFRGFPPNDIAGITPEKMAFKDIKANDKSIAALRKSGFAVSHVVPRGNMLPGQGCIISLKGDSVEDMILDESSSCLFQLRGARGVYPSTVIAVMAKWRELNRQAELYSANNKSYALDPVSKERPVMNSVLDALVPVVENRRRVFSHAQSNKDVYRSLVLQSELGYDVVLSNVRRVEPAIEALSQDKMHIILSTELPDAVKEDKKKEKGNEESAKEESDPRREALLERKKESIKEFESQAALLESKDVRFAFSMMDVKATDLKANLERMIAAGLSEQAAMNALTINAAEILGLEKICGSLEKGKMANLFLSTGPYLDKESSIKYSIVEGHVEEYEIRKKKRALSNSDNSIEGTWSFSIDVMGDLNTGKIVITKEADQYEVNIINDAAPDDPRPCSDISFEYGTLSLSLIVPYEDGDLPVQLSLDIDQDSFNGTATIGQLGSFPIEGSKISSPEN